MKESNPSTSTGLLDRAKDGDASAWDELYSLYSDEVEGWCLQSGLGEHDAADVKQEVFRSLSKHLRGYARDRSRARFRTWLRTITINKVRDYFRARKMRPHAAGGTDVLEMFLQIPTAESASGIEVADSHLTTSILRLIQTEFEDSTWIVFWRSVVDGEATTTIAGDLKISVGAIRQAKYRVLRRLRQELAEHRTRHEKSGGSLRSEEER